MLPVVVSMRRFPPRGFHAITLFPFVIHNGKALSCRELRHETVHLWQQVFLLVLPFYILYLLFWVVGLLRFGDRMQAYRTIPFEMSAYALEEKEGVKAVRQAFDWINYIKTK